VRADCSVERAMVLEFDDVRVQACCATLYLNSERTVRNIPRAIVWPERASAQGDIYSMYTLGRLLVIGDEILAEAARGIDFLEKAARHGDADSASLLGRLFLDGKFVEQDCACGSK
jgi:TPR repeat protein